MLQALIYVQVTSLVRRSNAWVYGMGFFIAAFWNYTNHFITTFLRLVGPNFGTCARRSLAEC